MKGAPQVVHVRRRSPTTATVLFVLCSVATVSSLAFSAPAGAVSLKCQGQSATIVGTDGPELIVGTNGSDVISAGAGDDTIRGLDGNDFICAGAGDDLVNGGLGNDSVMGESWQDEIQMSDPWVYCSTAASGFNPNSVETAFRDPADPGFTDCNPATGTSPSAVKIPDGGTKVLLMNVAIPLGAANLARDTNVRVYINAPKVGGTPDVCQLTISMQSPPIPTKVANGLDNGTCNQTGTDLNGTTFDSEASLDYNNINSSSPASAPGNTRPMNGRFHPSGSLDSKYRNKPVCNAALTDCQWKLTIKDTVQDGITGTVSWWALEINYGDNPGDGTDTVNCGSGSNDTVDYTARNADLTVALDGSSLSGQSSENDFLGADDANRCEWLYNGFGNDTLTGNSLYNDIRGGGGSDVITGLGGNDKFRGGTGNDFEYGGAGNDKLDGNDGTNLDDGGDGSDTCLNASTKIDCEH
jgi:Ca2+-binding RTX toxin-like protein